MDACGRMRDDPVCELRVMNSAQPLMDVGGLGGRDLLVLQNRWSADISIIGLFQIRSPSDPQSGPPQRRLFGSTHPSPPRSLTTVLTTTPMDVRGYGDTQRTIRRIE